MICPSCKKEIVQDKEFCPVCGHSLGNKAIPQEIKKWNWGAFLFGWIWGIGNGVLLALLDFVPFVGIIVRFVLGAKGSQWAWKEKQWESVEHFKRVQKKWALWGFIVSGCTVLIALVYVGSTFFLVKTSFDDAQARAKDARIINSISQARLGMSLIYDDNGNLDDFNCEQSVMMASLCSEITSNGGEAIIAHNSNLNSSTACIYSSLNQRDNYWYCADSQGRAGYTEIDPGSAGYCVDGKSAICPVEEGEKYEEEGIPALPEDEIEDEIEDGMLYPKIYQSIENAFEFNYPTNYTLEETIPGSFILLRKTNSGRADWLIQVSIVGFPTIEGISFEQFAIERAKTECRVSGANYTMFCDEVIDIKPFRNDYNVSGYEIYLSEIKEERDPVTGEEKVDRSTKGPIFVLEAPKDFAEFGFQAIILRITDRAPEKDRQTVLKVLEKILETIQFLG